MIRSLSVFAVLLGWCCVLAFSQVPDLLGAGNPEEAVQQLESQVKGSRAVEDKALLLSEVAKIQFDYLHDYSAVVRTCQRILDLRRKGLTRDEQLLAEFQMARAHARLGQHQEALAIYQSILDSHPANELPHQMAQRYIHRTRIGLLKVAEQKDQLETYRGTPLGIEIGMQIAHTLLQDLDQPQAAIARYQDIVRNHPSSSSAGDAQWRIADTYHHKLHLLPEALNNYKLLLEHYAPSSYSAEAEYQMGQIHLAQANLIEASQAFERLIKWYPSHFRSAATYYWLGDAYQQSGNYVKAVEMLRVFRHFHLPMMDPAFLAHIGRHGDNRLKVQADLDERIRNLESQLPRALLSRAEKQANDGNYLGALEDYRALLSLAPQTEHAEKARSRIQETMYRAEIQQLRRPTAPMSINALYRTAEIHEQHLNEPAEAIAIYRQIVDSGSPSWAAQAAYRIAVLYAKKTMQQEQALNAYQLVINDYPQSSEAMMATFQMGELYRQQQNYQQAITAYQNTINYPEREWYLGEGTSASLVEMSRFRIAKTLENLRDYTEAFQAFEEFVQTYANSPRLAAAYVTMGLIQEMRQKPVEARKAYEKARDLVYSSEIQAEHVVDEVMDLDFPGRDPLSVGKRIQSKLQALTADSLGQ